MARLMLHWQIVLGMAAGAVIGLGLNVLAGTATTSVVANLPAGLTTAAVTATIGQTVMKTLDAGGRAERVEVGPAAGAAGLRFDSLKTLARGRPELADLVTKARQPAAVVWEERFQRLGGLFLQMLKMVAVPLIVTSQAGGVMGLGGAARLSRMFRRTLAYYVTTSLLAILTGMAFVNLFRPGLGGERGRRGNPHTGLVMMAIVLQAVGLPAESQRVILPVDRVLDMGRTAVNVWSGACGAAVIDAWEDADEAAG